MSKKFLGKVAAGSAAVAGAFLLVAAPGVAQAAPTPDGRHDKGCIVTYPKVVKPGHEVKIIAKCKKPQDRPWAWSEVTGKVWLKPWYPPKKVERSAPMSGDENSSVGSSDSAYAPDGRMRDSHGHKDGVDARAPEDSPWLGGMNDSKADGMQDGRGHKDGIDAQAPNDSQWYGGDKADGHGHKDGIDPRQPADGRQLGGGDAYGHGHKDGIDPREPADGHQLGGDRNDGKKDGDMADGRRGFIYWGKGEVNRHAKPGKYWIKGSCGVGRLIVAPKGWVDGGDGGSTGTNTGLAAGGATALAAAAVGGVALVRRRRADGSLA